MSSRLYSWLILPITMIASEWTHADVEPASSCLALGGTYEARGVEVWVNEGKPSSGISLTYLARANSPEFPKVVTPSPGGAPSTFHARVVRFEYKNNVLSVVFLDSEGKVLATIPANGSWTCEGIVLVQRYDRPTGVEGFPGKIHVEETLARDPDGSLVWKESWKQVEGLSFGAARTKEAIRRFAAAP